MVRTISATEAKVNFGAVTQQVIDDGEPVVVENHGQPRVAIVPVEKLDRLAELEGQERQRVALERIRTLQEKIAARNQDLTSDKADAIADQLTRAAMDSLIARGTLRFEE
jgi:prevent-host-death family protein